MNPIARQKTNNYLYGAFVFLINFLIPLYANTGIIHVGHPIFEIEQQQRHAHSPLLWLHSLQVMSFAPGF